MDDTATLAGKFKQAFYDAAVDLLAGDSVGVSFGHPGTNQTNDIVAFLGVRVEQDPATFGTNRSREEVLTLTVVISCYRGGGAALEKVCSDRAYELLRILETYVRVTDTTLGGVVRHCFLTAHESDGATDPRSLAKGRTIEIAAVFTAHARVSS